MPNLLLRPDWYLPESAATDRAVYSNRRAFTKRLGLGMIGLTALGGCNAGCAGGEPGVASRGSIKPEEAPTGEGVEGVPPPGPLSTIPADAPRAGYPGTPAPNIPDPGRPLTDRLAHASYNNFYEFRNQGDLKDCWRLTADYDPYPWTLEVTGLVERPLRIDLDELIASVPLEERVYRFRCVEAWSMTVPWVGFPLATLVERCRPLSSATHVRFVSANRPSEMPGLARAEWYPWPYYEGLRMDEAVHPLAFVATGAYGEPLPKQNGSPLRLALPWKYGYKGPKAFERIEFVDEQPPTFWNDLQPAEYSFLSNVNPVVPHPRWSQATERFIRSDPEAYETVPTLFLNGYAPLLEGLYPDEPRG